MPTPEITHPTTGATAGSRRSSSARVATVLLSALALTLAACEITYEDTGPLPYGERRDEPLPQSARSDSDGEPSPADASRGNPLPRPGEHGAPERPGPHLRETPSVDVPPPTPTSADAVTVTSASGEYHKAGCALATGSGQTFPTAYHAIDAGFLPCDTCRPGP